MIERSFILKDEMGLHARPAAFLMTRIHKVQSEVKIFCGGRMADGKDIISMMALDAVAGDEIVVRVDGPEEEAAMSIVESIFHG